MENGSDTDGFNTSCPYGLNQCTLGQLEAYYVTAVHGVSGTDPGESPRSNVVFWKRGAGYARLSVGPQWDAIAQYRTLPYDQQACWLSDAETAMQTDPIDSSSASPRTVVTAANALVGDQLINAEMRTLGVAPDDPPWILLDLHTDHLGTVRLITDNAGLQVSRHDYFPFGEPIVKATSSFNTHGFTGHERDVETGLDYMLARYYGDTLPRFLSPDPLSGSPSDVQSWNRCSYVHNNPVGRVDPSGMSDAIPQTGVHDGPDEGPKGWWPSGPGGATGWGGIPCVMCFQRGDGWGDEQWKAFTQRSADFRGTISERTRNHFWRRYHVKIDEYYVDGKGPVVDAVPTIDGARAITTGNHFTRKITADLGDFFNPDGTLDAKVFDHAMLHESEHYANRTHHLFGPEPGVQGIPADVAAAALALFGDRIFSDHNNYSTIGFWAEMIQFGSLQ